jgi:predicted nucleic acid-binding Zn ribbon protein
LMGRRAPRSIGLAVTHLVGRVAPQTTLASVQTAWPSVAGEDVAREAQPVSEREGVVTILCRSSTWAEQLDLLQARLLESLREATGAGEELRELRFRVGTDPFRDQVR